MGSRKLKTLMLFGVIAVILGVTAFLTLEGLILKLMYSFLVLRNNSIVFNFYKDIPLPITNRFYFFNVTNANEIMSTGAKPRLEQIGPFTYNLHLVKTAIQFNGNDTVSFYENKTWHFDRKRSVANDDLKITTLNAPLAIALTMVDIVPVPLRFLVTRLLDSITDGMFIERTIKELTFDGYPDAFIALGPILDPSLKSYHGKFGYFWPKNGSGDSRFTIFTGEDMSKFTLINRMDGKPNLDIWKTEECNRISDAGNGETRPSLDLEPTDQIKIVQSLICRPLYLNFTKPVITKDGFRAKKFVVDENMYRNKTEYPANACYESSGKRKVSPPPERPADLFASVLGAVATGTTSNKIKARQYPYGVMDLSACMFGAPALLSNPHFLNADDYYFRSVDGMKPNAELHEFWLEVEPYTGASIDGAIRFQLNIHINKPAGLRRFKHVPEIVFPVLWQEMVIEWPPHWAAIVRWALRAPTLAPTVVFCFCFLIGLSLFSIVTYKVIVNKRQSVYETNNKIDDTTDDQRTIVRRKITDVNENKIGFDNMAAETS